jgi:hypothetical protein
VQWHGGSVACAVTCASRELPVDWVSRWVLAWLVVVYGKALIRTML